MKMVELKSRKYVVLSLITRKTDQKFRIGDAEGALLSIKGEQIRISISAPADIPVHLDEVYRRIKPERQMTQLRHRPSSFPLVVHNMSAPATGGIFYRR